MSSGRRGLDDLLVDLAEAVDIKVLQRMLGHSSAALTLDRYGHAGSGGGARQPPPVVVWMPMGAAFDEFDGDRLAAICREYGIVRLELFGSIARGEATADSDVDLLYELRPGLELGWEIADVEDAFEQVLGRRVDLIAKQSLHRRLRPQALADAVVLYAA